MLKLPHLPLTKNDQILDKLDDILTDIRALSDRIDDIEDRLSPDKNIVESLRQQITDGHHFIQNLILKLIDGNTKATPPPVPTLNGAATPSKAVEKYLERKAAAEKAAQSGPKLP